jgi:hypothetical protein
MSSYTLIKMYYCNKQFKIENSIDLTYFNLRAIYCLR